MYFNRKNAEQKNWRMIKKGKHFLFGCSLIFAVGASLATQVVHANTAETNVANNSTTGDVNPTPNGDGKTYEAPAAVAEIKPEVATTPAVAAKLDGETAKEVKALDKTKLEDYIAEIEAKLANGTYDNKTEESVAVLKADLETAKATLANATTQDEIKKAYNKLVTTANTKLKNKPVEKKETPAVDTTNGQPTVGKKAENTEKKSESNSIENTGSNDPRNGKALDKNNAFRAEVAYAIDSDGNAFGKKDSVVTSGIGKSSNSDDAKNAVNSVMKYRARYNTDATGKITSVDWQVFFNNHLQNFANDYQVKNEVFRNYIQIPNEVNMPTEIRRLQYKAEMKFVDRKYQLVGGDGSALSDAVSFDNPTPSTAAGRALAKNETLKINGNWDSYTRGLDTLYNNTSFYYKDAVKDALPDTKKLLNSNALPGKRVIYDNANTGGNYRDGYVWEFTTTVPNTVTNEQLKNMKVSMGMLSTGTAGVDHGFHRIAENPIDLSKADVTPPTVKTQTVKVGEKPKAENSIANFKDLPAGTKAEFKTPVDTATPGEKTATAVVTYSDGSKVEGPVKVIVEKEAVAPAKPVTPKPEAPKPSTPAPDAATNKPAAGAATNNPAATPTTSGPEIVNDLSGKASTPADVTVKAPAGSTVKLYNTDGVVIGEAVANAQGVATVHPTNSLPAGEITATSTPAGGKESTKSAPITVTASPLTVKDGGVTGNNDTRLLVSRSEITVYPGDKIDVDVVAQATALEKFSVEKNATAIKGVLPSGGYLGTSGGTTIRERNAKYSGTVAMDQPAGSTSVIFHAKNRDKPTTIYRELIVNVLETAKKYEPVAGTKVDIADSNGVSETEKNKIIEAVKAANPNLPADSQYSVDEKGNLTITYPDGSKDKIAAAYLVNPATPAAPVVAPTVEIPYSNKDTKEVYVYAGEENSFDIKFKDDSGKIASATVKQGGNKAFADVAGEANTINTQYGFKANVINAETPATEKAPAVITYSGTPAATDGLKPEVLEAATKGENPAGMALGWRYATATDTDGALIENKATGSSSATDPGAFRVMLKGQTQKYDIATPTEKVTVADPANVTEAELAKIKEKVQLEYSQNNDDANLADKKGQAVADKDAKIKSIEKDADGNLVVTYKDGSQDKKPLSEFVTKETAVVAPTVEIPYSNKDTKEVYVYAGEENSFDIKFKDDSGKIASATVKQGGNRAFADVAGEANTINTQYGFKANVINAETPATEKAPAVITYSGTPAATDGLKPEVLEAATKGENPAGMALGWRYATATDTDGALIENKATGSSSATDPGAFRVMLKGQTQKYDIATPTEKVTVADPANVTEAELAKIKEKVQLEYSQNNDDANLADKKGQAVADKDAKIKSIEKDADGNLVVTYKDGSQDKKPLSEFVTKETAVVAPTVEIPYSNKDTKEVYVYAGEENSFDIKFKDDSGKIASATVKQGGNRAFADVAGEANTINTQYGFKANVINAETPATEKAPAVITYSGTPAATDGLKPEVLEAATKGENPAGMALGWRYATATDTDGALIENKATGSSSATDPGAFRVMLKGQTQKYDIATPTEKVTVADPANVTEAELAKIKEKVQLEYSQNNDDANLADKKGQAVADKDAKIQSVTKDDKGNLVVTYKDGSQDKKPLSEFVTKETTAVAPTVEIPYSNKDTKEVYVYAGEENSFDIKFKDDSGKIASATVRQGGNRAFDPVAGEANTINTQYGFKANVINAETPATAKAPAVITYSGTPAATDGLAKDKLEAATKGENPEGMALGWRYATATDKDGAFIENKAVGSSTATDPGAFRVMLKGQTQKYDIATPTEKVTVADPANVTDADLAKIKEKLQLEYSQNNDDANLADKKGQAVADKDAKIKSIEKDADGNLVVTYKDGSQDKKPLSEFVTKKPTDADKNTPTGKPQTVNKGTTPKAEDSIGNVKDLPKGTKVAFKDPVDTATPGEKDATVVVTYPDGSKEEVPVKVTVKDPSSAPTDADKNTPTGKPQTVNKGTTPKAEDSIGNVKDLPKGTKVAFKDPVDTATPGEKDATVVVTYPDGSKEEVPVKVTVKDPSSAPTDADKNTPTAKPQTVNKGTTPKAEDSIGNVKDLPKGTKVAFKDPVDTATPGEKDATVVVTYPDGSKEEVPVKVTVKDPSSAEDPTTKDTDGDGLTDKEEADKGTDPKKADTDGDGFTDKEEVAKGTDPKDPNSKPESKPEDPSTKDTDGDGLTDKEEADKGTDPKKADTDGDGLTDKEEADKGTDPKKADTDGDGLTDKEEADKGTDPKKADTDGDGLTDKEEADKGTDPKKADTDGDGLTDKEEADKGTDPKKADTDGDGFTDKEEVAKGTDPKDPNSKPESKPEDPSTKDTDGDGLTDKEEADKGTDPKKADTDGDGLTDKEEADKGTDPKKADTDGDGFTDKEEVAKGTDPKDPNSKPEDPATADTKAPAKPEIKTDLTDKAGTKTPVEVTAEPGSKVELFDKDGNKLGEGVADENGKATITPTKELPAGDVTAKATDPAGNVSEPSTPEKATADTKAPAKPEIKTDLTDKAGTKTPVEVTAEPGSKVELFDKDGNKLGEGVADENGKATITPTKELPAGDVTAKATDPAGNVSEPSTPEKATADTKAPAKPEIKTDLTDKAGTKTPVEVTAEPGSKVELFDKDGNKLGEGVADENGKATITPTKELPAGDVTAKATDPAGNVSEPSTPEKATADTKAPAKPEIKTDLTDKAGTKTPVEVTAEPGSKVELFDKDGNKLGEGVADENGKATITPTKELPAGDVTAKATDPAGNVSEPSTPEKATADTKAPAKPEIKTDLTDKAGTKTPVEVTAEPGSKVELFDKDGNKLGEGVADENGKATITPTKELPAGDVTAKATDPAGNVSEPSTPEKATADTKAPAKPEIKTDLTDKAGTKTPVEVTAEPGSKVELFDKDGNKLGEGVADENGKATITPTKELPAGDVTAKATDPAGNVSEPSTPEKATADTKAPAKPEIKTDLTDKAGTKTPVEVTAEPGSKVELFDKDGNKLGEGVADENGKATITPTKELPAGDVTAKATDPAGNVSEPSTPEKATADTKAPAKPEIKTDLTDKAGTKTPVEVTAEPGSKVELFDKDGNKLGEGVADENGKATITPTKELPAGDVTAKATDPAGNVSEPSTPEKATADTKAPAKPEIKTDLTDKAGTKTPVEVTAEPGSKVELFDKDGNKLGEGVADENGKATITPTKELPAGDVTAKATDPAGNVSEPSVPAKATPAPAKPAVTPVVDPSNLTEAEKAKVADEVKKANPTVTDVKVGKDGTTTVTFPDGSTAVIPSGDAVKKSSDNAVKDPAVTPVVDPSNLTEAEKAKVADEVKKANPTVTDVKVGKDGTTTVTFPDGSTAVIPSGDTVKKSSDNAVKDPAVTPVVDPSNLTEAEKAKVADEVKKSNPTVTDVKVGKDGTTTVTFPDGSTAVIPSGDAVKKSSDNAVKDPAVTPVVDPSNLTEAEKAKVADEVKKSNPTVTDVKVGKDGTTTVTFPDGSTAVIPSGDAVKKSSDNAVKDPAVTPVVDPSNLTEAEKAKVADEVKKSNPTVTDVKVGKDGTTTVTFPDGSTAVIPSGDAVKKSSDNAVKDPAVTPVVDPSNLTEAEKAKVADEVKKANPTVTDVKVGKDGTTTVTFPDGSTAVIPSGDAVKKSSDNAVKDPAVTPVVDPSNLTEAEKAKVADAVKKSNPTVTDVKVGKDGTTTVTFPDGSTAVIPSGDTVKKSSDNAVKDPAVTPVVDPSNLTEAEKAKVADEVKKSNPTVTDVKVGKDGTTTVTFPDGSTAVIPSGDAVKKSSDNAVKDPAVTPVVDPSNLTEAEKAKVADEVKKANPTVTDVKVGKDGTTTVTFPDGSTAVIPSGDAVKKSSDNAVKDPAVTPVVDPSNLTEAEKAKVAEAVKKANPTVTDVKVGKDGTTTVTFPDGSTAVIPSGDAVKKSSDNAVKDPAVTPVVDPSNLTEAEKAKVAEAVKKANPTATDVKVGKDGTTTVTFPDGSTAVIPAAKAVTSAEQGSHAVAPAAKAVTSAEQGSHTTTPAKKAGAKELPNTGTEQSSASLALALLAAATGGLLIAKKREEEE